MGARDGGLVMGGTRVRIGLGTLVMSGLLVAFGLAVFASPLASSRPDGLNKVAADHGFDRSARRSAADDSPLAGYAVKDVDNDDVAKGSAGMIGVAVTLFVAIIVFARLRHLVRQRSARPPVSAGSP
jgi:hypothetical protein